MLPPPKLYPWPEGAGVKDDEGAEPDTSIMTKLRKLMSADVGVIRNGEKPRPELLFNAQGVLLDVLREVDEERR